MILVIILIIASLVVSGTASILWIFFMRKRMGTIQEWTMNPLARGPRYRDGIISYNQLDGMRFNVEIEDPRGLHSSRYRRRHSPRQRKQKKPWMQ